MFIDLIYYKTVIGTSFSYYLFEQQKQFSRGISASDLIIECCACYVPDF